MRIPETGGILLMAQYSVLCLPLASLPVFLCFATHQSPEGLQDPEGEAGTAGQAPLLL